ncbi:MAG: DUF4173 domain-containing protein [Clostridia bacterium]
MEEMKNEIVSAEDNVQMQKKNDYSNSQRWLLLATLTLGVIWDRGWEQFGSYAAFWLVYLALFYTLNWRRVNISIAEAAKSVPLYANKTAWAIAAGAVALCVFGNNKAEELMILNRTVIPLLLMVHMAFSCCEIPLQRELAAVGICLRGTFIKPFSAIPRMFGAVGSLFSRQRKSAAQGVWIGLAVGIPLTAVVLWLLASADAVMGELLQDIFSHAAFGDYLWHAFVIAVVCMLFYSFLYNVTWGKTEISAAAGKKNWPTSSFAVVTGLLLAVYAVFTYVQFTYLFGGRLPQELTYSEYARQGFGQLIVVALINFTVIGAYFIKSKRSPSQNILMLLLLSATVLLLGSAGKRLLLYIGAYGLTMMRILPLWFMLFLVVQTILCAIRLYKEKIPLMRIAALTLIYWYVAFNLLPWTKMILQYNSAL